MRTALPIFTLLFISWTAFSQEKLPPKEVESFLSKHCYECHDDSVSKGNLNLLDLDFNLNDHANFEKWAYIYERIETGEMPPKSKKDRPQWQERKAALDVLIKPVWAADQKDRNENGRVNVRRLNPSEYEHTVHDLLGIDIPLKNHLPEEAGFHGFETVAASQQLSHHNLARYLEVADRALDEAFGRAIEGSEKKYTNEVNTLNLGRGKRWPGGNYRGPETRGNLSIHWPITLQFYGRMPRTRVPADGWYRITLKGVQAFYPREKKAIWGTLRSGACASNAPMMFPIAAIEATREKRDLVFEAWIQKDHMLELKPNDSTLKRAPNGASGGNVAYNGPRHETKGISGIALNSINVERIYPNAERWEVRKQLIGNIKKEDLEKAKSAEEKIEIFRKTIHGFANRAFRRPTSREQVEPYVKLAAQTMNKEKASPADALRAAYRGILVSPHFLTLVEKPGKLDDHALACRLSYMLWNSMPDRQLRQLADQGKLKDSKVYHDQVSRMFADEKSDRFIANFTDQWLNLKAIDETTPDRRLYPAYDPVVRLSLLEETRAFVKEMMRKNLSVTNLIDSDFAFLNERLARFYSMGNVKLKPGEGLQKVSLGDYPRGGLITQGAILKVTANGTTTSPVVRGVWVNERILGRHIPPPPPGIPAVEPDIRGAVSIRDQLAKHSTSESCMGCHQKIDPAGFALENFDPIGRWRTVYGKGKNAAKVNPTGVTPDGKKFPGIKTWKEIYVDQPDLLARNIGKQMITFATGAPPRFSDRDDLAKIVKHAREKNYGMRSILHAVVSTDAFRVK